MKHFVFSFILALGCLSSLAMRHTTPFNSDWAFRFAHQVAAPPQRVDLPHTWNSGDALAGNPDYYRGMGIYEKSLTVPPQWHGKRIYIRFQGANQVASLFVNHRFVGEHKGGYGAFVFDITDFILPSEPNLVTVKVTNALNLDIMPLVGDFNMYGGIYRQVDIVAVDPVHISLTDHASPGVYLTQRHVSHESADVQAAVVVANRNSAPAEASLRLSVSDNKGVVFTQTAPFSLPADTAVRVTVDFSLKSPRLWNGVDDPFCYTATAEIISPDGTVVDCVSQPLGLRYYSVDSDKGFMLNGSPLRLRGVCRHQDRAERGNALFPVHHAEDADIIEEIGANAVRLAHYPQAQEFYSLMDKKGMIVWAEIPFIGPGGYHDRGFNNIPAFRQNGRMQLVEMIRQHYNHPSICFWGIFNELKTHGDNPLDYVSELNDLAHAEDPVRPTVAASFLHESDPINSVTDLIAWNKYYGWYGGSPAELGEWLDQVHSSYPQFKIGISEYGAGASVHHQQDSTLPGIASGWWHPENYQTDFHVRSWKAISDRPYVWASFIWNLFDFGAAHRTEGDRPGINDKGLVTFDRKIKKDAFYFYKANWNKHDKFVYIANHRHDQRNTPVTTVTLYTNRPEVELMLNGTSLGKKKADTFGTVTYTGVTLRPGANTLTATAPSAPPFTTVWHLH